MAVFVAALLVFVAAVIGMAIGVILNDRCLKGTCGGLNHLPEGSDSTSCSVCSTQPTDENSETQAEANQTAETPFLPEWSEMQSYDIAIIGGGIVGLATAYRLLQHRPQLQLILLEKEAELAQHQTGHNSGVIHSGIYYRPGSLRAENCRTGKQQLTEFCQQHDIPFDLCGKVIVATSESERSRLQSIFDRGQQNGVTCELIHADRLAELEPHANGIAAIHVPEAGIVDYKQVSLQLAECIRQAGGEIRCSAPLHNAVISGNHVRLITPNAEIEAKQVVTCAGLQSDRVAALCGWNSSARIIPFRGEYYVLKPHAHHLCRNLIYPVPDPNFPFLGVHLTRMIGGGIECGPNAVLSMAREGYHKLQLNPQDLCSSLGFAGFRKLALKHWQAGLGELYRSFSKSAFVKALQKLVPEIQSNDLVAAPAGIRAQAVSPDGKLVDDFMIEEDQHFVHVLNAPSPAATSSLNIGETISQRVLQRF